MARRGDGHGYAQGCGKAAYFLPTAKAGGIRAGCPVRRDLRFWNRLYFVAFDDVVREICDVQRAADPALMDEARDLTARCLRYFARPAGDGLEEDAALARDFDRLLRGTLFVRFGEQVLYWMDHLPEVEAEYERRCSLLRGRRLTAEHLRPYVDRGQ